MVTYQTVIKSIGSHLNMAEWEGGKFRSKSGHYYGKNLTIQINIEARRGSEIDDATYLRCKHNNCLFLRNHEGIITGHRLKLICSQFEKDIINGKIMRA